jgi:hypothetical protein
VSEQSGPRSVPALLLVHWDEVLEQLSHDDRERLTEILTGSDPLPVRSARVNQLLLRGLPPDAAVTDLLFGSGVGVRLQGTAVEPAVWRELASRAAAAGLPGSLPDLQLPFPRPSVPDPPRPDAGRLPSPLPPGRPAALPADAAQDGAAARPAWLALHLTVRERFAQLPWLPLADLPDAGADVLRLPFAADDVRVPTFQLDPARRPYPAAEQVNRMLDARHDPWGVTSWWVCRHAWLGCSPAELLPGRERELLEAATSVLED